VEPVLHATRARLLAGVTDEELDACLRVFDAMRAAIEHDDAGVLTGSPTT
jgi:hypothetical protein